MEQSLEPDPAVGSIQLGGDSVSIAMARKPKIKELKPQQSPPVPRARDFVAPDCSVCVDLRPKPIESYVRVYATVKGSIGVTRYCKCGFCGNTFKSFTSY